MVRQVNLTRDEAEYLVDLLESKGDGVGLSLAEDIRELFGMCERGKELPIRPRDDAKDDK